MHTLGEAQEERERKRKIERFLNSEADYADFRTRQFSKLAQAFSLLGLGLIEKNMDPQSGHILASPPPLVRTANPN